MRLTFGDIFSGGGGASIGARLAGYDLAFAVEREPEIAACYRRNLGEHIICADVLTLDPATLLAVDCLWCSPPCQNSSVARSKKLAPHADAEAGRTVTAYVRALRPRALVLENVPPYADTPTFRAICADLAALGYFTHWAVVNSADYGVPQTRRRLILRAMRDTLVPPLPAPVPWVGWYAAIEDLLPAQTESRFADWQLRRLPALVTTALIEGGIGGPRPIAVRQPTDPSWTVVSRGGNVGARAFLVHNQISQAADAPMVREDGEPAPNVTTNSGGRVRAFLVSSSTDLATRAADEPAATVTATAHTKAARPRTWLDRGRVVSMTPRALARFQSFPDWYELPASRGLACKVVGNAAPPLLAQVLLEGIAAALDTREDASA